MFSLTYSAAYDPYHTVFRMLALNSVIETPTSFPVETLRIIDFYHKFPWLLNDFKSTNKIPGFQKEKRSATNTIRKTRFDKIPDKYIVYQRMHSNQIASINALIKKDIFHINKEEQKIIMEPQKFKRGALSERVSEYSKSNYELLRFLIKKLAIVPLLGPGGLKDRSGLGEFRYDII
jgi:hypothetical protein